MSAVGSRSLPTGTFWYQPASAWLMSLLPLPCWHWSRFGHSSIADLVCCSYMNAKSVAQCCSGFVAKAQELPHTHQEPAKLSEGL